LEKRKNREHQKNKAAVQLELFTRKAVKPDGLQTDRISRDNLLGDELLPDLKVGQSYWKPPWYVKRMPGGVGGRGLLPPPTRLK